MSAIAAGIGAAGSILGGITGGKGAASAAKAQAQAQQQQLALEQNEFNTISGDASPTISAGNSATSSLMDLLGLGSQGTDGQSAAIGSLQQSPLYQSEFNSGLQGVDQSLAASGGLRGGNGALAQSDFGSQLLNSLFQQQVGNLGTVVGQGNSALGTLSGAGSNFVNSSAQTNSALGNANATAAASPYAAIQSALSGLSSTAGKYFGTTSAVPSIDTGYTSSAANSAIASILGGQTF